MTHLTVVFAAADPMGMAQFWSALVGDEGPVRLRFVHDARAQASPSRLHLHVTSEESGDQAERVATALQLGATHLDLGQLPEEGHVVLADPEGNPFCVIEPDNRFLAGCGPLGEVACDGSRALGVFWSSALGWPLVWDQDDETAIQSPSGGTKVAWGGAPDVRPTGRGRQWFELVVEGRVQAEADRLTSLGARRSASGDDGALLLVDPDGNEFVVRQ